MKALYFDGAGAKLLTDYARPKPEAGESLVRIELAAVCSTDKEILRGYKPDFKGVMGHEFVGTVEESPDKNLIGKMVVGELNEGCGECVYCKSGREGHCENRKVIGLTGRDGCFAEYMTIKTELLHAVPKGMDAETAIFTEPLAAALEIAEQSHIMPSTSVAVIGDGRLAYMIAQVVALTGAELTVIGRHREKLAEFESFANTLDAPGGSYEVVIDATGSPSGIFTAIKLVRSRGLLVLKSTYADSVNINLSELVVREITLRGSRCGPFAPALSLLRRGLIRLPELKQYPLENFEEAFESREFKVCFKL